MLVKRYVRFTRLGCGIYQKGLPKRSVKRRKRRKDKRRKSKKQKEENVRFVCCSNAYQTG